MQKTIAKEQRTDSILSSLKKLTFLSRSQLQILHGLGGERNAQRVMKELEEYVHSFRDGENIYYLSKEGRERVGCRRIAKKTLQARHYVMRNSIYIAYDQPDSWKNEVRFGLQEDKKLQIICDALFKSDGRHHIVEVDHTQKMSANRIKIEKYKALVTLGMFEKMPKFIWMTTTEYRRNQLAGLCEGLDVQIFTASDFH
ncbi:MAG TPA: replication-relaxation family protein [Bacillus sp. (in: firmicutes)]|nr:replication-relaxation family protein [Bacillus sp. (in: firmicutes)]